MRTIYKILIAFLAISLMIGIASADNQINWHSFNIAPQAGEYGIIEFTPNTPAPSGGAIYWQGYAAGLMLNFDYEVTMPAPSVASVPDCLTIPMPFDCTRLQDAFAPRAWDYVDIEIT